MKFLGLLLLLSSTSYAYQSDLCVSKHSDSSRVLLQDTSVKNARAELSVQGSDLVLKSMIDPRLAFGDGGGGGGGTSGHSGKIAGGLDPFAQFTQIGGSQPSDPVVVKFSQYLNETGVAHSNSPDLLNVVSQLNECD